MPAEEAQMTIDRYLDTLQKTCLALSRELRFDKTHPLQFTLVAQYGSILELAGAIVVLRQHGCTTGVPAVFRTLLETSVEFSNLSADPKYGYYWEAADLDGWLRLLKAARRGNNPYLADLERIANLGFIIDSYQARFDALREDGYRPLTIGKRFERAGMSAAYESVYNMLSADAHSNRRALIGRHLDITSEGFDLTLYKSVDQLAFADTTAAILLESTRTIHAALGRDAGLDLDPLEAEFGRVRAEYASEA
jgi:hypothetical protein